MVKRRREAQHRVKYHKCHAHKDGIKWRFECICGDKSQCFDTKALAKRIGEIHGGKPWTSYPGDGTIQLDGR